jgi:catechol 2,3-dioxygenase-like lactoylglutathione lyase family enzyme
MESKITSIRPFIGAKDFEQSRNFYRDLNFTEIKLGPKMSLFQYNKIGFYLQDYFLQDWLDNSMLFFEVESVEQTYMYLLDLKLMDKYPGTKLIPIRDEDWGRECFLHDPAGVLLHFGEFK